MNEQEIPSGYVSTAEAKRILHISASSLRVWSQEGKIECIRKGGKGTHRYYNIKTFIESRGAVKQEKSVIVEYQPEIKQTISTDKNNISKQDTQLTNSLETLDQVLTSRGKDLKPFWDTHTKENSKNLWLPIKTDCVDLDSTSLNILLPSIQKEESSFLTTVKVQRMKNSSKTSCPSLQSSQQESMVSENTKTVSNQNSSLKMMKIRILPNPRQKKILNIWFGVHRRFFNEAKIKSEKSKVYSFRKLRNSLRKNSKYVVPEKWDTGLIPPRIITGAIKDYCSAFKTGMSLFEKKLIKHFEIHKKRKKQRTQTLNLEKSCFGKDNILFPNRKLLGDKGLKFTGTYKLKKKKIELKDIPINHGCRISYNNEKFYLLIPYMKEEQKTEPKFNTISMDSGIRTFQTGYCPEGHIVEIGKNPIDKLRKQLNKIDILNKVWVEILHRKGSMRKQRRFYAKIKNKIDDFHWKTIKFLTSEYKTIIISDFKTKDILKLEELRKISKRTLGLISHYKFRQRLIEKCMSRGNELHIQDESFTSKTCGKCGKINQLLGSSKEFICPFCGYDADRDVNAGRNILLKFLQPT